MNSTKVELTYAPPSLIKSLMAGFDAISNHVSLILFSISLDLLLWLGPRIRVVEIFKPALEQSASVPEWQNPEMTKALLEALEQFNLLSVLRTLPVGIFSLMANQPASQTPLGVPASWEVPSFGAALGLWLLITLTGLALGAVFFLVVSQAALFGKINWRHVFSQLSWTYLQVVFLAMFWLALFVIAVFPLSCLFSLLLVSGVGIQQVSLVVVLLLIGIMIWLLVPLIFSPHGIFVNQRKMWSSVGDGLRLTRLTLPTTGLMLIAILVLSGGLDVLWRTPPATSWFTLVGIAGHAFVTTSLLAASFIYYRDADRWVKQLLQKTKMSVA